jgi:hypothetical protein
MIAGREKAAQSATRRRPLERRSSRGTIRVAFRRACDRLSIVKHCEIVTGCYEGEGDPDLACAEKPDE